MRIPFFKLKRDNDIQRLVLREGCFNKRISGTIRAEHPFRKSYLREYGKSYPTFAGYFQSFNFPCKNDLSL